jgi:hypothetical protein
MARISKAEHGRILHLVDVEGRKVAEVAAEYGCTPANIYALLGKLRRAAAPAAEAPVPGTPEADAPAPQPAPVVADLFAAVPPIVPATEARSDLDLAAEPALMPEPSDALENVVVPEPAVTPKPAAATPVPAPPRPVPATVTELPRRAPASAAGVGAKLAKPGFGLVMRTAEGEENTTPFRSLDDLLSAVKPILRTAARSPDPVWFSIQSLDLSALDSDAA